MKRNPYIFTLMIAALLTACDRSDIEYENNFEKSRKAWLDFKEASNNSYRYVVTAGSWAGFSWWTAITVENGEITQRDFRYNAFNHVYMPQEGWDEEVLLEMLEDSGLTADEYREQTGLGLEDLLDMLEWTEENHEVGTRQHTSAASPRTLDDIYETARNHWLQKRPDAKISFETNNDGLISSCGYWMDGCQDDCFNGIHIASVEAL